MRTRNLGALGLIGILGLVSAGCGQTDDENDSGPGSPIVVGTTDTIATLDPAGAYDNGSFTPMNQIYPYLMNSVPGDAGLKPDVAEKCEFTAPVVYTCTLKPGLKFANGHPLTAASVKHSYDRIVKINDPNGPISLLTQLDHTDAVDPLTVAFTLKNPNDQTFPQVLATNAGPIVDEQVFPGDKLLDDNEIVKAKPFAGPFTIETYKKNQLVDYKANPDYAGVLGKSRTDNVTAKYYATAESLTDDVQKNTVDVGFRSFTPADIESLRGDDKVTVYEGPGGELRFIVFNLNTMPGGTPEQKLAVRKAVASSIDRDSLSRNVYKGTYAPAYSSVPPGVPGSVESYKDVYGATPNKDAAVKYLADAGIPLPVEINLQYNMDHFGSLSDEEYAAVKSQLEGTGLFKVNLQQTEWAKYEKERTQDAFPVYQLGWFPDFPDADNYLTPFFAPNNFLQNHFDDKFIADLIVKEATEPDFVKRTDLLRQIQDVLARDHVPMLPLLSSKQIAVAAKNVDGVPETLDASFKFRYTVLSKH
jgi:peptide/nickel transport system substrate-binding protein